jgi:NADH:ubiquinone oxidoreductase subunit 5 (subunit L)/multisubunit Na+/H+ antiporter MnhA subunit
LLKNKYYFDEAYEYLFIKPLTWFSEVFVSKWMDKGVIDSILHIFGPATGGIGSTIRNYFDVPVVNQFFGDGSADVTYWIGKNLRPIQTGRIQQYLILSIVVLSVVGGLVYFFLLAA